MKLFSKKRNEEGGVMAETAIVLPMFLGIVLFIIEFGTVIHITNSLKQISRTAARYAATHPTASTSTLATQAKANLILPNSANLTLTVSPAASAARNFGQTLTVTTSYSYTPLLNPYLLIQSSSSNMWAPIISAKSSTLVEITQ